MTPQHLWEIPPQAMTDDQLVEYLELVISTYNQGYLGAGLDTEEYAAEVKKRCEANPEFKKRVETAYAKMEDWTEDE